MGASLAWVLIAAHRGRDALQDAGGICNRRTTPRSARPRRASVQAHDAWQELGELPEWMVERLGELDMGKPTSVQQASVPTLLRRQDAIVHAETGSGKTLCYLVPAVAGLQLNRAAVQAVVIVPSQELGMQVYKVARRLLSGAPDGQLPASIKGASVLPMLDQADAKRQAIQLKTVVPRLIVGTPRRLLDLVKKRRLRTETIETIVVDEFDAIFGDNDLTSILHQLLTDTGLKKTHQTILASATVPQRQHFLKYCVQEKWMQANVMLLTPPDSVTRNSLVPVGIDHRFVICEHAKKLSALRVILERERPAGAIVFVHMSRPIPDIVDALNAALGARSGEGEEEEAGAVERDPVVGLPADAGVKFRRQQMDRFRNGEAGVLVVNDSVGSRGLDVPRVSHVINLDLPETSDQYLHRAGRTGRQDRSGRVVSICSSGEGFLIDRFANSLCIDIEKLVWR